MAQGHLRSFLSMIALISLMGGTLATIVGLVKVGEDPTGQQTVIDEEYIVPAAIGNTLCVIFLIWLTITIPGRPSGYQILIVIFLMATLITEIYLTFFVTKTPGVYGTYVLVIANFLIRTFFVLEYVQDTWTPITWKEIAAVEQSLPKPFSEPKPVEKSEEKPKPVFDEKTKEIRKKIGEAIGKMREDPREFDGSSQDKAYKAFNAAIDSGKSAEDAYKDAKFELKYKDGSAYTGAGRRRRA